MVLHCDGKAWMRTLRFPGLLQEEKEVNGYGLDVDPDNIRICLNKGVNVIEQDLD